MPMYTPEQEEQVRSAVWTEIRKNYKNQTRFAREHDLHKGWLGYFLKGKADTNLTRPQLEKLAAALAADPDDLIRVKRRRAIRIAEEPHAVETIAERITDGDEIKLIYLARGWGVAKSLRLIQEAKAYEDRQATIVGQPTTTEIKQARRDDDDQDKSNNKSG